jgi:hypothetical protein
MYVATDVDAAGVMDVIMRGLAGLAGQDDRRRRIGGK